ncbi:alpha/beta fold hydrolase [Pseudoneobacillus sp. C159]
MFAQINGTKIYFDIEGSSYEIDGTTVRNKPVCFVLHGGPGGTHVGFKPHLTPLTSDMQFVYIDNRGSGLSEKGPQSSYTLENNVEDIEALRNYLGLEKIILLGHSYGGMVAMSYALKYQENLESLILITTSPSFRFLEKAKAFIQQNGTADQKEMADVLWEGNFTSTEQLLRYYEVMAPLYQFSFKPDAPKPKPVFPGQRSYEALNEGFGHFLRTYDIREQLPQILTQTLVIAGRYDWITPVEESEQIAEKIPNSKLVIFENSSHSVFQDEHEKFINVVREFLKTKKKISI